MAVPWSALIAGTLGTIAAVRALYHPYRALTRDGYVRACAAESGCDPAMMVDAGGGVVYAPMAGLMVSAGPTWAVLKPDLEDVMLSYAWSPETATNLLVAPGQHVGAGQQIAVGGLFRFSVRQLTRGASTTVGAAYEPSSWLAVRGLRVSTKSREPSRWCEGGRALTVPQEVARCGLELPAPSPLSLLPVTVALR